MSESIEGEALAARLAAGLVADCDLAESDWAARDCTGVVFRDCTFRRAVFTNTTFEDARFERCVFDRCRFAHAKLRSAVFDRCIFLGPDDRTSGCVFSFADLHSAQLSHCDLSFAQFDRSSLFAIEADNCRFVGARFAKTDFSHAYGRRIVEHRATFRTCTFELASLAAVSLREAELTACNFREADLSGADLTDAVLRQSTLSEAVTTGATFDGADLRGAEISGLDLTALAGFNRMKIDDDQARVLLESSGVVFGRGRL